jgi:hypothetical protein
MILMKPKCDYDILYIGTNAFISELYDQVGSKDDKVELIGYTKTRQMIKVSSMKSWRMDHIDKK